MNELDGLLAAYIARDPDRGRKRLRELVWEDTWQNPGPDVPDFSELPKEVWGMIVERCLPTKKSFVALLLLNKQRISPAVWGHFPFSSRWRWSVFATKVLSAPPTGFTKALYGFTRKSDFARLTIHHSGTALADAIYEHHGKIETAWVANAILPMFVHVDDCFKIVSRLFRECRPDFHADAVVVLLERMGCSVFGDISGTDDPEERDIAWDEPDDLIHLDKCLSNIRVALGYYDAYRAYALSAFGMILPKIKRKK